MGTERACSRRQHRNRWCITQGHHHQGTTHSSRWARSCSCRAGRQQCGAAALRRESNGTFVMHVLRPSQGVVPQFPSHHLSLPSPSSIGPLVQAGQPACHPRPRNPAAERGAGGGNGHAPPAAASLHALSPHSMVNYLPRPCALAAQPAAASPAPCAWRRTLRACGAGAVHSCTGGQRGPLLPPTAPGHSPLGNGGQRSCNGGQRSCTQWYPSLL